MTETISCFPTSGPIRGLIGYDNLPLEIREFNFIDSLDCLVEEGSITLEEAGELMRRWDEEHYGTADEGGRDGLGTS